jgi:Icc-related predicted phosphoesterase
MTGRAAEQAAKRNAEELAKRKDEISISRAQEAELLETAVFDPKNPDTPILIDEIEEVGVSVNDDKVVIRTISDIEDMTYGVINGTPQSYTFKQGVKYSVPRGLAIYLENLGYTWRQ